MVVLSQIKNKRNQIQHTHIMIDVFTETSEVLVIEKSYRHWNKLITLPICFRCDGSEISGRGQKDVLVM